MVLGNETTHCRRVHFTTTHWTVVLHAGADNADGASAALEQLCQTYWPPLYSFVRWQGFSPAEAQDITQGFFERFLEKNYLGDVNREKGRFRSFLLVSIKHYIQNERKRARRVKRGGDALVFSIDQSDAESRHLADPNPRVSPESAYDQRGATTLMDLAMKRLGAEHREAGREALFLHLKKFLSTEPVDGEYARLAILLDMSHSAVAVSVHRLRQRFGEMIRAEITRTVAQTFDVDDEMRHLYAILTGG